MMDKDTNAQQDDLFRPKGNLRIKAFYNHIKKRAKKLSILAMILGIVWIFLFPIITISTGELKCRGTYFSENALLPDVATPGIRLADANWAELYQQRYCSQPGMPTFGCANNCSAYMEWMQNQFDELGLEVYKQEFTDAHKRGRTNIYGIVRASPGADGKECIVLVAHYRNLGRNTAGMSGMSIGMTLLRYLRQVTWLSKDVILLLSDDGPNDGMNGIASGVEAWLRGYHADPTDENPHSIPMHAGVIRGAIVIDTESEDKFNSVAVLGAGMNGQLPNLDLVNTAVHAIQMQRIDPLLDRCDLESLECNNAVSSIYSWCRQFASEYLPSAYSDMAHSYLRQLFGMFQFMKSLGTGPTGAHGHFIRYNIDAITMHARSRKSRRDHVMPVNFIRALESVIRSLSNIEEKLHQSFYLYLLPSDSTFVSVGEYYYTIPLISLPALVRVLQLGAYTGGIRAAFAVITFTILELAGLFLVAIPYHWTYLQDTLIISEQTLVLLWICSVFVCQIAFTWIIIPMLDKNPLLKGNPLEVSALEKEMQDEAIDDNNAAKKLGILLETEEEMHKRLEESKLVPESGWQSMKCGMLLLMMFSHAIIGILNYPFALAAVIVTLPYAFIQPPRSITSGIWLIVASPLCLFAAYWKSVGNVNDLLISIFSDFEQLGSYLVPYFCIVYLPVHTVSLYIWLKHNA